MLESGETLLDAKLAYRTAGTLDARKANAILFPTWFTGTSEDLFTTGSVSAVDTTKFFLIAVDAFGNGVSSSPSNSARQRNDAFPRIGIGDMVMAQRRLVTEILGIEQLHAVMGISMGGMQTFEWLVVHPTLMKKAVPIVGSPRLGSYDLLLWRTELEAIEVARTAGDIESAAPVVGMVSALALADSRVPHPNHPKGFPREAGRRSQGGSDGQHVRSKSTASGDGRARRLPFVRRLDGEGRRGCRPPRFSTSSA